MTNFIRVLVDLKKGNRYENFSDIQERMESYEGTYLLSTTIEKQLVYFRAIIDQKLNLVNK